MLVQPYPIQTSDDAGQLHADVYPFGTESKWALGDHYTNRT